MKKSWCFVCLDADFAGYLNSFPVTVGRGLENDITINIPYFSRSQFVLKKSALNGALKLVNKASNDHILEVNGEIVTDSASLLKGENDVNVIRIRDTLIGVGLNYQLVKSTLEQISQQMDGETMYFARIAGRDVGPFDEQTLCNYCLNGQITPSTIVWTNESPNEKRKASDFIDFGDVTEDVPEAAPIRGIESEPTPARQKKQRVLVEDEKAVLGKSFACPYCRSVSKIDDLLSVSVSPTLRGDAVLGEYEQSRFLPSQFTVNGLAIDADGGVCTEIACPVCHMSFNQGLLDSEQIMMSVIGTAGAGKSVFWASSIWQCRSLLSQKFGVSFFDLDPVANRWINAYEEKFFFRGDSSELQQIAKTDLSDNNLTKRVNIDGNEILLPLPSFFQVKRSGVAKSYSLVVYDSAGEHFQAGADRYESQVTLNMLNADVLYFMFDPSADPSFSAILDMGTGSAKNYAQRQDTLLSEMKARIRRHCGTRYKSKLDRPLIVGISKADLLKDYLDMDTDVYKKLQSGRYALDLTALKKISDSAENFMNIHASEVVEIAKNITNDVWFLPVSSLGHNPQKEGVRPADIKPLFAELPIVYTLARKGLIEVCKNM